jgi:glyoxylase-like metal-dependent hydrolase (beta-lactamase superfamily II)
MLKSSLGGLAGIALGARLFGHRAAGTPRQVANATPLGENLFLIAIPGETNVLARRDGDGVLLVDGASSNATEALLEAVAGLFDGAPAHTLFNTHWHPEHTGLNERVGASGGTIIAHENTRLWLTTDVTWPWDGRHVEPLPEIAQPNETFWYEMGETASGVQYGYIADAAHTDGDIFVYFPEENVLAAGDVISGDGWPMVDWWTGGWIGGIVGGLQRLIYHSNAETRIIPGRGRVLSLADVEAQAEMYSDIYGQLSRLLNSGRGPEEAVEARPTAAYDAQMGPPDDFVRRAFESQWAYTTPDA